MARPTKSAAVVSGVYAQDTLRNRLEEEAKLKGSSDALVPPDYLSENQREIFQYIVDGLRAAGILGGLDVYVLTECSICIDRMQTIEREINEANRIDPALVRMKDSYTKAFFRYCNELSLSPQSRAKMANAAVQAEQKNPLEELLSEEDD